MRDIHAWYKWTSDLLLDEDAPLDDYALLLNGLSQLVRSLQEIKRVSYSSEEILDKGAEAMIQDTVNEFRRRFK